MRRDSCPDQHLQYQLSAEHLTIENENLLDVGSLAFGGVDVDCQHLVVDRFLQNMDEELLGAELPYTENQSTAFLG